MFTSDDIVKIITATEGIFTLSDFTKAMWIDGDESSEKYVLGDKLKNLCNGCKTVDEIIAKIQGSDLYKAKKAINDVDKSNIAAIMNLADNNEHISVLVTKNGDKYKIQFFIDGKKEGEPFDYSNSDAEPYRSFSKEELLQTYKLSEQDLIDLFEFESSSQTYKLSINKIQDKYSSSALTNEQREELSNIDTIEKLIAFRRGLFIDQFDFSDVTGYNNGSSLKLDTYNREFIKLLQNGSNSLYKQLQDMLGDKFEEVYNNALNYILDNPILNIKDAVDKLLSYIYENTQITISAVGKVDLTEDEKAFIEEIAPESVLGDTYKSGLFDDIRTTSDGTKYACTSDEMEGAINKLKATVKAWLQDKLVDIFDNTEFNDVFSQILESILDKYSVLTEPTEVKVVVNDFLKQIYECFEDKINEKQNEEIKLGEESIQALSDAAKADKTNNNYNTEFIVNLDNLDATINQILNNGTENEFYQNLYNYVTKTFHIRDFENAWLNAIADIRMHYKSELANLSNGSENITLKGKDIINKFIQCLNNRIIEEKEQQLQDFSDAAEVQNVPQYKIAEQTVPKSDVKNTVENILSNTDMKARLKDYAASLFNIKNINDNLWNDLYDSIIAKTVKYFENHAFGGSVKLSGKTVIDKFLEFLDAKLQDTTL